MTNDIDEISYLLEGADSISNKRKLKVEAESSVEDEDILEEEEVVVPAQDSDSDEEESAPADEDLSNIERQLQLGALADLMVDEFESMITSMETIRDSILTMKKILGIEDIQKAVKGE